jgi:cytochrome P450
MGTKFTKDPEFYRGISFPRASIGLIDPAEHRIRRQVLSPVFSPTNVQDQLAPLVYDKVRKLCKKLEELMNASQPVNINASFKAFTLDVISKIVFGEEFGVLDSAGFRHIHVDTLHEAVKMGWVFRSFPTLSRISLALPEWISALLFPIPVEEFRRVRIASLILEIMRY